MNRFNRRAFLERSTRLALAAFLWPLPVNAENRCRVPHPLSPPDPAFKEQCPNCGMRRAMWARTWKRFRLGAAVQDACSFHCLADMSVKADQPPRDTRAALFLQPRGMVPAAAAWYVVGSSARGTMSMISKAAFPSRGAAEAFQRHCGGAVHDFVTTFQMARETLGKEKAMLDRKRLDKGKIIMPVDNRDECVVCRMYPARYPHHRSQISYGDGHSDHFCSTHCLFDWLAGGKARPVHQGRGGMIWVTDFPSGRWISAQTAYFAIDSGRPGPMGAEAFAFDRQVQAQAFIQAHGGRVATFAQITAGPPAWTP
jgi:nitrous oxide reductase accessory protein NosL